MNAIDVAIVVLLALDVIYGLKRGFILEVATIVGVVVALLVAKVDYVVVRNLLVHVMHHSHLLVVISYLIVFLIVIVAILLVAGRIRALARLLLLGGLDRIAGGVVGFIQGILLVAVLLSLARRVHNHTLHHSIHHSHLASVFHHLVPYVDRLIPHIP